MANCGAKTRSGTKCQRAGMPNGRCRLHGGATPFGPANPNFRTGKHSKWLPKGIAADYEAAAADPQLLTLRDEVALVDVRIGQLLRSVGATGNASLWRHARQLLETFKASVTGRKTAAARVALQELEDLLVRGESEATAWEELREILELRRRLTESETKRLKDLNQLISVGTAIHIMQTLLVTITEHVSDREALSAITDQFVRLTGAAQP